MRKLSVFVALIAFFALATKFLEGGKMPESRPKKHHH
jgi:hypothetical protein